MRSYLTWGPMDKRVVKLSTWKKLKKERKRKNQNTVIFDNLNIFIQK